MSDPRETMLVGVDGGGTGTRVRIGRRSGAPLADARGGPSGLALGVAAAWQAIGGACEAAFAQAGLPFDWDRCVLGCGLAGSNHSEWHADFLASAPPVRALTLVSDAYTSLLGAHGGAPGVVVALGTGSIAQVLYPDGGTRTAGGYGFPAGDEASGAWLGLRALAYAQQALDGRTPCDDFAGALLRVLGATERDAVVAWAAHARQTQYATLAPVVLAHAAHPVARRLLDQAGAEIGRMIDALDPQAILPVALCGGLGDALAPFMPAAHAARRVAPTADAVQGALLLAARLAAEG